MEDIEIAARIKDLYWEQGYSLGEVAAFLGWSSGHLSRFMTRHGIRARTYREARELRERQSVTAKRTAAILETKYGTGQLHMSPAEHRLVALFQQENLPFIYTGDGKVIIEKYCPDFMATNGSKTLLEVGHTPDIEKKRGVYLKYGFRLITLDWDIVLKMEAGALLALVMEQLNARSN